MPRYEVLRYRTASSKQIHRNQAETGFTAYLNIYECVDDNAFFERMNSWSDDSRLSIFRITRLSESDRKFDTVIYPFLSEGSAEKSTEILMKAKDIIRAAGLKMRNSATAHQVPTEDMTIPELIDYVVYLASPLTDVLRELIQLIMKDTGNTQTHPEA